MLKKIDLYIIKRFFIIYFLATIGIIVLVIIFDITEKIDNFIKRDVSLESVIFNFYIYYIPELASFISPFFIFISTIALTSVLANNNEIISIYSTGISFYRLLLPYIFVAITLSTMVFLLSSFVIPVATKKKLEFDCKFLRTCESSQNYNVHKQIGENSYLYLSNFNGNDNTASMVTIENFDSLNLINKTYSMKIKWDSLDVWTLSNYFERSVNNDTIIFNNGDERKVSLKLFPQDFKITYEDAKKLNLFELDKQIEHEKQKGSVLVEYFLVERYNRYFNFLVQIILTILGVSFSSQKKKGGMGINLTLGTFFAFLFIFFQKLSITLSTKSNLDVLYTMLAPIIFFTIVTIIFAKLTHK